MTDGSYVEVPDAPAFQTRSWADRQVILPQPDRPHAFQPSRVNSACTLCARRLRDRLGYHDFRARER